MLYDMVIILRYVINKFIELLFVFGKWFFVFCFFCLILVNFNVFGLIFVFDIVCFFVVFIFDFFIFVFFIGGFFGIVVLGNGFMFGVCLGVFFW